MGSTSFLMPQQQIVIAEKLRIAAVFTDERVDELIVAQGRYQLAPAPHAAGWSAAVLRWIPGLQDNTLQA